MTSRQESSRQKLIAIVASSLALLMLMTVPFVGELGIMSFAASVAFGLIAFFNYSDYKHEDNVRVLNRFSPDDVRDLSFLKVNSPPPASVDNTTLQHLKHLNLIEKREQLLNLGAQEFENLVANLFRRMGYEVRYTPNSSDEGIDLFLSKTNKKAIVQCKRYDQTKVGQPIVRDLYGAMFHEKADEAYLVTTGLFSQPAQQWARGKPIQLIDGNELIEWIESFDEK